MYFTSALVLPGYERGSGGRNAGTVTLHELPSVLLLHAGIGNTVDLGVFGRDEWYTMFKPGFTPVLQPKASSLSFLGSSCPPNKSSGVSLLFSSLVHLEVPLLGKHSGKPGCKELMRLEVSLLLG